MIARELRDRLIQLCDDGLGDAKIVMQKDPEGNGFWDVEDDMFWLGAWDPEEQHAMIRPCDLDPESEGYKIAERAGFHIAPEMYGEEDTFDGETCLVLAP